MKHVYYFLAVSIVNIIRLGAGVYWELPELAVIMLFIYAAVIGRMNGGIMALLIGLIEDAMIGRALGLYAVSYLITVYFVGYITSYKVILGNTFNLFVTFLLGSFIYKFVFWTVSELIFEPDVSFIAAIDVSFLSLVIIQSIVGVILYPHLRGLLIDGGYLFKY